MRTGMRWMGWMFVIAAGLAVQGAAGQTADSRQRFQDFSADPGWEQVNNRNVKRPCPITTQEFGHQPTQRAGGKAPGEIGGMIQRSKQKAYYAKPIPVRGFQDRLSASGVFTVEQSNPSSGMLFGWFNAKSRGWRTANSLAFRIYGTKGYARVTLEYCTRGGKAASFSLKGDPHRIILDNKTNRPVEEIVKEQSAGNPDFARKLDQMGLEAFSRHGSHRWSFDYDPNGAQGLGEITLVLDGETFRLPLEKGHKAEGVELDRFGMLNVMFERGGPMEIYFDDVVLDGKEQDFSADPKWEGVGNQAKFEDSVLDGMHDYGWCPTRHAGGKAIGELGGIIFRQHPWSYTADAKVGPLDLNHPLDASGKLAFTYGTSDSAAMIGWFDSKTVMGEPDRNRYAPPNFVGVLVEGPSRIGHYFRPTYRTTRGNAVACREGPVIFHDGAPHNWSLHYAPEANKGHGRITVTLDGESVHLDLPAGTRTEGARFDRFGLASWQSSGGHFVELYVDDLDYTVK